MISSTIKLLEDLNAIKTKINHLQIKDAYLDKVFREAQNDINRQFQAKITDLENELRNKITQAEINRNNYLAQINNSSNSLTGIISLLPAEYDARLNKLMRKPKQTNPQAELSFNEIDSIIKKIKDDTFIASLKRMFHLQGYKSKNRMLSELLTNIEKSILFLQREERNCHLVFENNKTEAQSQFEASKNKAEKKRDKDYRNNQRLNNAGREELNNEIVQLHSDPMVIDFANYLTATAKKIGAFADWTQYAPAVEYPEELMLGGIQVPLDFPPSLDESLGEVLPYTDAGRKTITLPLCAGLEAPLKLIITYLPETKDKVMTGVQNIILHLLRFMPDKTFKITYIDPIGHGSNLGKLQKLYGISSDICKKTYASNEDIYARLKVLEAFVDKTNVKLGGLSSVHQYNMNKDLHIERHIVIINDYPEVFSDRRFWEIMRTLLNNADRCGISFIFTADKDKVKDIPQEMKNYLRIESEGAELMACFDSERYSFIFDDTRPHCDAFLDKYKQVHEERAKVDNNIFNYFDLSVAPSYEAESTELLEIPFALDNRGRLISLKLGGESSAHALLSGDTGSGKSRTLNAIINSIIMNYHPEDVELMLVDYKKVEFAPYIENPPPHIRIIALEKDPEFTFSFLDMLYQEHFRRMDLFARSDVVNIAGYKKKYGARSLPRLIVIIDEFHLMTQAVMNTDKKLMLENILSEVRASGISCFFCDQGVQAGLQGLTERGRNQIHARLAMRNRQSIEEIKATLGPNYWNDDLKEKSKSLKQGEFFFNQEVEDENGDKVLSFDKYRCLHVPDGGTRKFIDYYKQHLGYQHKDLIVVNGKCRQTFELPKIEKYENALAVQSAFAVQSVPIYVGAPVTLAPYLVFYLEEKPKANNIMLIGADGDVRSSLLYHILLSFRRWNNGKVIIYADEYDDIAAKYGALLAEVSDGDAIGVERICEVLAVYQESFDLFLNNREFRVPTLHVWLGLEYLASVFSRLPEQKALKTNSGTTDVPSGIGANLNALRNEIRGNAVTPTAKLEETPAITTFNCMHIIERMIAYGHRIGQYTLITSDSTEIFKQIRTTYKEMFKHKIALKMSDDDSIAFLGNKCASMLDEELPRIKTVASAFYCDGATTKATFRPYLLPERDYLK